MADVVRDRARFAALRATGLLDNPHEPFHRVTRLAAAMCGAPLAVVSLVSAARLVPLAVGGRAGEWVERPEAELLSHGLCEQVVATGAPLRVPDAADGIGAYLGVPLWSDAGQVIGALCVVDFHPRDWTTDEEAGLIDLAAVAASEVRLSSSLDELRSAHERLAKHDQGIAASEARHSAVLSGSLDSMVVMDASGTVVEWNAAAERTFGYRRDEAVGELLAELIVPPEQRAAHKLGVARHLRGGNPRLLGQRVLLEAVRADGSRLPVEVAITRSDTPDQVLFIGWLRDLTQQQQLQHDLMASESRLRAVVDSSPVIIFAFDHDGVFSLSEGRGLAALGLAPGDVVGRSVFEVYADEPDILADCERALKGDSFQVAREFSGCTLDMTYRAVLASDGSVDAVLGVATDITARRRGEARLAHLAYHDALTGLLNRSGLEAELEDALVEACSNGSRVALFYVDVDNFKDINASLGHGVGDEILKLLANRLRVTVPADAVLGRHSGDEFMVVLSTPGLTVEGARQAAEKLHDGLAAPLPVSGIDLEMSTSIGVSVYPDHAKSVSELLSHADAAVYRAKRNGRANVAVYLPHADTSARRLSLTARLRRAITNRELDVVYQPVVDLETGKPMSVEALARWTDPDEGPVSPTVFIPLAEESGLIISLGEAVLEQVAHQLADWQRRGIHLPVAMNISARQMRHDGILKTVDGVLDMYGVSPSRVIIELTESAAMADSTRTVALLRELRERGMLVAVDDFGTGYSSLARLRDLPVTTVKLDQSFVAGLPQARAGSLVNGFLRLAEALELRTIAEGVETAEQHQHLRQAGCNSAQGYLFGHPMAPAAVEEWLLSAQ